MKKIEFEIKKKDEMVKRNGYRFSDYFAIHKSGDWSGIWTITHLPSGFKIWNCELLKSAKLLCSEITKISGGAIKDDEKLYWSISKVPEFKEYMRTVFSRLWGTVPELINKHIAII